MQYQVPPGRVWKRFFQTGVSCGDLWDWKMFVFFSPIFFQAFLLWEVSQFEIVWEVIFSIDQFYQMSWDSIFCYLFRVLDLNLPCRISQVSREVLDTLNVTLCTGASHRGAPAPTVPCAKRQHDCFMLLAGVPSWLTDAELRKHAGQFGQVWETFA